MSGKPRGSVRRKPNLRSSIYLGSDGKWHGYVTMGIRSDGRPDRRHRSGATEAEVTRKIRELEGKRDAGTTSRPGRAPTVAAWMRTYLTDIAPLRVSQGTLDSTYRPKTERWITPKLGRHRLNRLYPVHLYAFYTRCATLGWPRTRSSRFTASCHGNSPSRYAKN